MTTPFSHPLTSFPGSQTFGCRDCFKLRQDFLVVGIQVAHHFSVVLLPCGLNVPFQNGDVENQRGPDAIYTFNLEVQKRTLAFPPKETDTNDMYTRAGSEVDLLTRT